MILKSFGQYLCFLYDLKSFGCTIREVTVPSSAPEGGYYQGGANFPKCSRMASLSTFCRSRCHNRAEDRSSS